MGHELGRAGMDVGPPAEMRRRATLVRGACHVVGGTVLTTVVNSWKAHTHDTEWPAWTLTALPLSLIPSTTLQSAGAFAHLAPRELVRVLPIGWCCFHRWCEKVSLFEHCTLGIVWNVENMGVILMGGTSGNEYRM